MKRLLLVLLVTVPTLLLGQDLDMELQALDKDNEMYMPECKCLAKKIEFIRLDKESVVIMVNNTYRLDLGSYYGKRNNDGSITLEVGRYSFITKYRDPVITISRFMCEMGEAEFTYIDAKYL